MEPSSKDFPGTATASQAERKSALNATTLALLSIALFVILGSAELYLGLRIQSAQNQLNERLLIWDNLHHAISELRLAVRKANTPGNDVFLSGVVRDEHLRFIRSEKELLSATRNFQLLLSGIGDDQLASVRIRELQNANEDLLHFARQVFSRMGNGQLKEASGAMAEMDAAYGRVNDVLDKIENNMHDQATSRTREFQQAIRTMRRADHLLGLLLILFLAAILVLGPISYRRLEQRMVRDRALADRYLAIASIPALAVAELDPELNCISCNERWASWTVGESGRWQQDGWRQRIEQGQFRALTSQIRSQQEDGDGQLGELWVGPPNQADSKLLHVYLSRLPHEDNLLLLATDVSGRQSLVNELLIAIDSAKRLNSNKDQVLAGMGHELRTPLNAIIGFTDLLREDLKDRVDEQHLRDLGNIRDTAGHLMEMINKVLDLSSLQAGQMRSIIEVAQLQDIVRQVTAQAEQLAARRGNRFVLQDEVGELLIETDVTHLLQVLLNLLGNASKFTEAGTITLQIRQQHDQFRNMLEFAVIDTGIGIPEQELSRLYTPYYQSASSGSLKRRGTGLGLSISLSLARLLGGTLIAESAEHQGSTFRLRVPIDGPSRKPSQATRVADESSFQR